MSILFAAGSATLDRFLQIDHLEAGSIHRPTTVIEVAGGKALNAAWVANRLGAEVATVGCVGGPIGGKISAMLAAAGIDATWIDTRAENRICTSIGDAAGRLTEFYEPAPSVTASEWEAFTAQTIDMAGEHQLVAMSGAVPSGVSTQALTRFLTELGRSGARRAMDLRGAALSAALSVGVEILKVNVSEAREVLEVSDEPAALAQVLLARLAAEGSITVVTDGHRGATLAGHDGVWSAGAVLAGAWSVGSGDAFLGGMLAALDAGASNAEALRAGSAAGAANTLQPGAGRFSLADYRRLLQQVQVIRA